MPAGASLTSIACPRCREVVPLECGNIGSLTLDDLIAGAMRWADRMCPARESPAFDEHLTIKISTDPRVPGIDTHFSGISAPSPEATKKLRAQLARALA
jgi:hypothetical protein